MWKFTDEMNKIIDIRIAKALTDLLKEEYEITFELEHNTNSPLKQTLVLKQFGEEINRKEL